MDAIEQLAVKNSSFSNQREGKLLLFLKYKIRLFEIKAYKKGHFLGSSEASERVLDGAPSRRNPATCNSGKQLLRTKEMSAFLVSQSKF